MMNRRFLSLVLLFWVAQIQADPLPLATPLVEEIRPLNPGRLLQVGKFVVTEEEGMIRSLAIRRDPEGLVERLSVSVVEGGFRVGGGEVRTRNELLTSFKDYVGLCEALGVAPQILLGAASGGTIADLQWLLGEVAQRKWEIQSAVELPGDEVVLRGAMDPEAREFRRWKNERALAESLPPLFQGADRVTLVALDPMPIREDSLAPPDTPVFMGWFELGRVELKERAKVDKMTSLLGNHPVGKQGWIFACYQPRHGLIIEKGDQRIEMTICFFCQGVRLRGVPKEISTRLTCFDKEVEVELNRILDLGQIDRSKTYWKKTPKTENSR